MLTYRKSTIEDCGKVYELICDMENTRLPYERFSSIYAEQLEDERFYCLIAEEGGIVAGMMNLRMEVQLHLAVRIAEIL